VRAADGLDPDETLLVWMPLSFAGSAITSTLGAFSARPGRRRREAVHAWSTGLDACGFPFAGGDLVLGVSDRQRLHVWRPQLVLARPGAHAGWFPLARVLQVATRRTGLVMRLTLLVDDGTVLGFESMRGTRVRRLADAVEQVRPAR
jgi:hypothetical protein